MTEDEHPNERLVTPSEDGEGFERTLVSRRSMLGGSALLAGLLAYTGDPTQPTNPNVGVARASHNPDEPLIILGPESDPIGYLFQDTAGGIILQDATSGNHFWYNQSQGRWETDAELNVPTLAATTTTTEGLVVNGTHHWASQYDGADADARLANALSAASNGDIIHLENASYSDNYTIPDVVRLQGTTIYNGTSFSGNITVSGVGTVISSLRTTGDITIDGIRITVTDINLFTGSITANADKAMLYGIIGDDSSVTFAAGTSEGIVDASIDLAVTDNGTNTVGDIA